MGKSTDEYFIINLTVNGRRYPLRIRRCEAEEEIYRKASRILDQKINQYKSTFLPTYSTRVGTRKIDETDCIIMTALQAVSENAKLEKDTNAADMEEKLRFMIEEIDTYLSNQ